MLLSEEHINQIVNAANQALAKMAEHCDAIETFCDSQELVMTIMS